MLNAAKDKFEEDLDRLLVQIDGQRDIVVKLANLGQKLADMKRENLVKINHSVMELLCASALLRDGFEVDIEHTINQSLLCDVFATKGDRSLIVELETGFIPPEHALDPTTYTAARIVSKIARYSSHSDRFSIGIPPHIFLPISPVFVKSPSRRNTEEVLKLKALCDLYYRHPPVSEEEIRDAHLHAIRVVDLDRLRVEELEPKAYMRDRPGWSTRLNADLLL